MVAFGSRFRFRQRSRGSAWFRRACHCNSQFTTSQSWHFSNLDRFFSLSLWISLSRADLVLGFLYISFSLTRSEPSPITIEMGLSWPFLFRSIFFASIALKLKAPDYQFSNKTSSSLLQTELVYYQFYIVLLLRFRVLFKLTFSISIFF